MQVHFHRDLLSEVITGDENYFIGKITCQSTNVTYQ